MTIRKRIDEAIALARNGFDEAALIIVLVAIAGASRRKYGIGKGKDRKFFTRYIHERLNKVFEGQGGWMSTVISFSFNGKMVNLADVLYDELRCNLIHEAEMPADVKLDSTNPTSSLSIIDGNTVQLGRGWLELLTVAVVHDPDLRPMFEDMTAHLPKDLVYQGDEDEQEFLKQFMDRFYQSEGRLSVIRRFLKLAGVERLNKMSDEQLRAFWDHEIASNPEALGLAGGEMSALSTLRADYYNTFIDSGAEAFERSFHSRNREGRYRITSNGIAMTRALLERYTQ
jgi:hypothetical protein